MDKKDRKFAVPYNGSSPDEYISIISPYLNNIDSIYFGLPGIIGNNNEYIDDFYNTIKRESNTFSFLGKTKTNFPKRLLVCNSMFYNFGSEKLKYWIHKNLLPLIEIYKINGMIISEFNFAKTIREFFPNFEIQTSCNSCHFSIENFKRWKEEIGVSIFNPPRDILRHPDQLKEIHNSGYKIKCLVNELCIVGCPEHCSHFIYNCLEYNNPEYRYCRDVAKLSDVLKCGFILPQWYDFYDDYIDIYKISGRLIKNNRLKAMLDCFINCNYDSDFFEVTVGEPSKNLLDLVKTVEFDKKKFPIKNISKKLIDCGQKNCEICDVCKSTIKKYLKKAGIELSDDILKIL